MLKACFFCFILQNHYLKDVPFHNCTHAADVTQTSHTLLSAQAFEVSVYPVLTRGFNSLHAPRYCPFVCYIMCMGRVLSLD